MAGGGTDTMAGPVTIVAPIIGLTGIIGRPRIMVTVAMATVAMDTVDMAIGGLASLSASEHVVRAGAAFTERELAGSLSLYISAHDMQDQVAHNRIAARAFATIGMRANDRVLCFEGAERSTGRTRRSKAGGAR